MNNPIDIGRMYGLSGTNTQTMMNNPDDMNLLNRMVDIPQMNESQMSDEMCMPMQNRGMNIANETSNQSTQNTAGQSIANTQMTRQNNSELAMYNKSNHNIQPQANVIFENPYMQKSNNIEFMNDLLRTHIGKLAEVEFLIGTNNTHIRRGQLTGVGSNYIVLKEFSTGRTMIADFYNIKFVTIYDGNYR